MGWIPAYAGMTMRRDTLEPRCRNPQGAASAPRRVPTCSRSWVIVLIIPTSEEVGRPSDTERRPTKTCPKNDSAYIAWLAYVPVRQHTPLKLADEDVRQPRTWHQLLRLRVDAERPNNAFRRRATERGAGRRLSAGVETRRRGMPRRRPFGAGVSTYLSQGWSAVSKHRTASCAAPGRRGSGTEYPRAVAGSLCGGGSPGNPASAAADWATLLAQSPSGSTDIRILS